MDSSKEIALAVLGGSVSLAGLLLIFCGFLFSQAGTFPADSTPDEIINRYKNAARIGVIPFLLCLVLSAVALWWLLCPSAILFTIAWGGFLALLGITAAYGSFIVLYYL